MGAVIKAHVHLGVLSFFPVEEWQNSFIRHFITLFFFTPMSRMCVPMLWWPPGLSKLTEMNLLAEGRACSAVVLWGLHSPGPHLLKWKRKKTLFSLCIRTLSSPFKKKKREREKLSQILKLLNNLLPNRLGVNSVHPGLSNKKRKALCPGGWRGRLESARVNFSINKVLEQRTRQG